MSEALHSSLSTSKIREYLNQSPTFHQAISRSSNYSSSPSPSQRSSSRLRATPSPSQPKRVYLQLKAQTPNFKSSRSSSKPPTSPIPKTVHKTPPASPVPKFVHQTPRKIDFKLSNDLIEPADQNAHNTSFMRPCYKEPKDSLSRSFELDIIQPVQNKQCLTPDKSSSSGSLDSSDIVTYK